MVHSFAHAAGRFAAVVSDFAVGRQFAMLGMPVSSIGLHLVGWYVIADLGPLSPLVADFTNSYFLPWRSFSKARRPKITAGSRNDVER